MSVLAESDPVVAARCRSFARGAGLGAMVAGAMVLVGWALDVAWLKSLLPGGATMKPNTAVGFILAGFAQFNLTDRRRLIAARTAAALAGLLGLLTLGEILAGFDLGIDALLFKTGVRAAGDLHPGRMAPVTALCFLLLGAALLLRDRRRRAPVVAANAATLGTALLSLLALLGYLYGVESLYRISGYSSMALHTAGLFFLLGLGVLAARPDVGLVAVIARADDGGLIARRILPFAVLLPLFFGWVRLQGERAGHYGLGFGLALFALSNVGMFSLLVWLGARELSRLAARRREIEAKFSTAFHSSAVGLVISTLEGRFVEMNPEFCALVGYTRAEMIGRSSTELGLMSVPDRERLIAALQAAGGSARNAEVRLRTKQGLERDVLYSVGPVLLNGIPHRLSTGIDVTARKQAEAALAAERDRSQALSHRLLEAQETERRQIARDLHDELGQILTAVKINLQTAQHRTGGSPAPFSASVDLVDRALQQTRSLSLSLRPPLLDDLGLAPALRWLADQQTKLTGQPIALQADVPAERPVPAVETACFRIAQEALTNALRHARAPAVTLDLRATGTELQLTVSDNGVGFDPALTRDRARRGASLGLLGMEERASLAGGRVEWSSAPGRGTVIRARFPLLPAAEGGEASAG